ncbi:MAG: AMP-binding protein [Treponema sp.]|nr:AMP-binding protein [Treponema sp.]
MYATIPQMLYERAQEFPAAELQFSKDKTGVFQSITYGEFSELVLDFGAGLLSRGVHPGTRVGLISDNRKEWLACSMGIMAIGCADIPRGSEATVKDLSYILSFAECSTVIVESNYSLKKIIECKNQLPLLKEVIMIDPTGRETGGTQTDGLALFSFEEILREGKEFRKNVPGAVEEIMFSGEETDTATIIFTSGTTGKPKGVELTHLNFTCQLRGIRGRLPLKPQDKALCVLPVWHIYEREMEYVFMDMGVSLCYSKPVSSVILADMKKIKPQFMACVPRVWEAIYKVIQKQSASGSKAKGVLFKICKRAASAIHVMYDIIHERNLHYKRPAFILRILNKALYVPILLFLPLKILGDNMFFLQAQDTMGGEFKLGMSGGGGLAPYIDKFFNAIGIRIIEGYGLTETAPICAMRDYRKPVLGTIGRAMPYCEIQVRAKDGSLCKPGEQGVLYVRGKNVMHGYYHEPELTAQVLQQGWFNTGDIVVQTYTKELIVRGRQKDTIVLRSGENVEPVPIENKLEESPYVSKAVIVGQDQNCLGALIIPAMDALEHYAQQNDIDCQSANSLLRNEKIRTLIFGEMEKLISPKNGFKSCEKIGKFVFLDKPFEVGVELSAKGSVMRQQVNELYKKQITLMYTDSAMAQQLQSLSDMLAHGIPLPSLNLPNINLESLKTILFKNKKGEQTDEQQHN